MKKQPPHKQTLKIMKTIKKKTKVNQYGETLEYNSRLRRWELVSNHK